VRRAVIALVLLALPPALAPAARADEKLSNESTLSRWAHANVTAKIRARPSSKARSLARLRYQTEDGPPEVYPVLRSRRVKGALWLQVRIPGRPNGRKGWVPRAALSSLKIVHTSLRVNRQTLRATLYDRGRKVWSSPIGVGKASTPTPRGRFWIRERLKNFGGNAAYGPWAFGTSAYSSLSEWPGGGVIGMHGTNEPGLIPGRPSHGCIRVPNAAIRRLAKLMPVGTPLQIL
jgi:lipoprotein-anchoring transpeptidase ErfK/SrfK